MKEINGNTEEQLQLQKIKKENAIKFPVFVVIIVCAFILGIALGVMMVCAWVLLENNPDMNFGAAWLQLQSYMSLPARPLLLIGDVIFAMTVFLLYRKAVKIWKSEREEDEKFELTERYISLSLILNSVAYCYNFVLFGVSFYNKPGVTDLVDELLGDTFGFGIAIIDLILAGFPFMTMILILFFIQKKCVELVRVMNPEKKGSLYDPKFNKVWYESCDEAERIQIGNASYKAFKITNMACLVLMIVFAICGFVFEIGILPFIIPSFIFAIMQIVYGIECMKNPVGN